MSDTKVILKVPSILPLRYCYVTLSGPMVLTGYLYVSDRGRYFLFFPLEFLTLNRRCIRPSFGLHHRRWMLHPCSCGVSGVATRGGNPPLNLFLSSSRLPLSGYLGATRPRP